MSRGIDCANESVRLEKEGCAARQFAPQAFDEPGAKAAVLGYHNGWAPVLAPAKAQPVLFQHPPHDIDLSRFRFESTVFQRIRAKLMERHRPRGRSIGRDKHVRSVNHEPVARLPYTKRCERLTDDLTQVRCLPIALREQIMRAR